MVKTIEILYCNNKKAAYTTLCRVVNINLVIKLVSCITNSNDQKHRLFRYSLEGHRVKYSLSQLLKVLGYEKSTSIAVDSICYCKNNENRLIILNNVIGFA